MRRHTVNLLFTTLTGLALVSCSSGGDAKSLGPVPSTVATTTTVPPPAPTTTTVAASGSTSTTRPPSTAVTSTTLRPVLVAGIPQVIASPAKAPVGARVRIEGTGFTDDMWKAATANLWLAGDGGCDLFAQATHSVTVTAAGRLSGEFTVPATGNCRMSATGERPVFGGAYRIVFACTACAIGAFEVTAATSRPCADVAFAPNSDNLAGSIVATGLTCAEAEGLVRKVGVQVGAVGGPSRVEVDGFTCIRTAENDRGLPSSDFECTNGTKVVTFNRT
jgi:hypothetical protein